jgi:hypothetical protein
LLSDLHSRICVSNTHLHFADDGRARRANDSQPHHQSGCQIPSSPPGTKRSPTRPTWTPVNFWIYLTRTRLYIPVLVIQLAPRTVAFQSFSRESHNRIEEQIIGYACEDCAPYSRHMYCTSVISSPTAGKIQPSGCCSGRMPYGRHMLSIYTNVPRPRFWTLLDEWLLCLWLAQCISDTPQCMHLHLHLPCVLSGPPQRHGDGDKEDSAQARRNGTQNPHIDPTWS